MHNTDLILLYLDDSANRKRFWKCHGCTACSSSVAEWGASSCPFVSVDSEASDASARADWMPRKRLELKLCSSLRPCSTSCRADAYARSFLEDACSSSGALAAMPSTNPALVSCPALGLLLDAERISSLRSRSFCRRLSSRRFTASALRLGRPLSFWRRLAARSAALSAARSAPIDAAAFVVGGSSDGSHGSHRISASL